MRTASERSIIAEARAIKTREAKDAKARRPPMVVKQGQSPRVHNKAHLAMIRRLPCLATLIETGVEVRPCDPCHVRSNYPEWRGITGGGRKPDDWRTIPMTRAQHSRQHGQSEKAFWAALNVYPPVVCMALRDAPDFDAMLNVIRSVAAIARGRT